MKSRLKLLVLLMFSTILADAAFCQSHADSTQGQRSQKSAVEGAISRLDSIQAILKLRLDSLRFSYDRQMNEIDSMASALQKEMDSLTNINLRWDRLTGKLDSLQEIREGIATRLDQKLNFIKRQLFSETGKLNLSTETSERIWAVLRNGQIPFNLNNTIGNLSGVSKQFDALNAYSKEVGNWTTRDIAGVENVTKIMEERIAERSGIEKANKATEVLDEYEKMKEKVQDPDSLKEVAAAQIQQAAINHFAGKQQQLQRAMEAMKKYKYTNASVPSVREIKKNNNEMKGKPMIERIVPGIALQIQKKGDDLVVDFNPYTAYRFTGRLRAGIGWNQRIGYNMNVFAFNPKARIYGPRTFGEFQLGKGFSPRLEIEIMNTEIPQSQQRTYDPAHRAWVWGAFAGMKKEYRLFKSVKGTAMVMARLVNRQDKSPYADVVNVRFGFEFPMKKKIKKTE